MKREINNPNAVSHKRAQKYVNELSALETKCRLNHCRDWSIPYLQRVYELDMNWRKKRLSKERRADLNRLVFPKRSIRKDQKTLHLIIECTSKVNSRTRSRWVSALLLARVKDIEPKNMPKFLVAKGHGGIAGRADEYGELRKKKAEKKKGKRAKKPNKNLPPHKTSPQRTEVNDDWD